MGALLCSNLSLQWLGLGVMLNLGLVKVATLLVDLLVDLLLLSRAWGNMLNLWLGDMWVATLLVLNLLGVTT